MVTLINKIENWIDGIKAMLDTYCCSIVASYGDSFFVTFIKLCISFTIFIGMLIPTWIGMLVFVLTTWACGVQSTSIMLLMIVVLIFMMAVPQLWLGFMGICMIALVLLA